MSLIGIPDLPYTPEYCRDQTGGDHDDHASHDFSVAPFIRVLQLSSANE